MGRQMSPATLRAAALAVFIIVLPHVVDVDPYLPSYTIDTELIIPATPQEVWTVFSDYQGWQNWNQFMTFSQAPHGVGTKGHVLFRISGGSIKTSQHDVEIVVEDPNRELLWKDDRGANINVFFKGSHWFRFSPTADGQTRMVHGAKMLGLVVPFVQATMQAVHRGYHEWNQALSRQVQHTLAAVSPSA